MAGKRPFSIATLMTVILALALDFALLRSMRDPALFVIIMILPMLNLLLLGFPSLIFVRAARPFWKGFMVVGWTTVGLILFLAWYDLDRLLHPMLWLYRNKWVSQDGPAESAKTYACVFAIYAVPQMLATTFSGWLSARYRVVIERRAADDRGMNEGGLQ